MFTYIEDEEKGNKNKSLEDVAQYCTASISNWITYNPANMLEYDIRLGGKDNELTPNRAQKINARCSLFIRPNSI